MKATVKPVTSQTIGKWIKKVLSESVIDVSVFKAHSTRHSSTSAANAAGVVIDVIRKTAVWAFSSYTFAKFYNRPITDDGRFAKATYLINQNEN